MVTISFAVVLDLGATDAAPTNPHYGRSSTTRPATVARPPPVRTLDRVEEIEDGEVLWRVDTTLLASSWTCIWGRGCLGILPEPAEEMQQGCCSLGADLGDEDEARFISAMAAMLQPERFQHHAEAATGGIFADGRRLETRVVDGACIFLNRPDFDGGPGCALHLAAPVAEGVSSR